MSLLGLLCNGWRYKDAIIPALEYNLEEEGCDLFVSNILALTAVIQNSSVCEIIFLVKGRKPIC
jgi:hypothetical protein